MERNDYIDKSLARQLACACIEALVPNLKNEKYYEAEDKLTSLIAKKLFVEIGHEYWYDEVVNQLECYDDEEAVKLAEDEDFVNSTIDCVLDDDSFWQSFGDIVDWKVQMARKDNN